MVLICLGGSFSQRKYPCTQRTLSDIQGSDKLNLIHPDEHISVKDTSRPEVLCLKQNQHTNAQNNNKHLSHVRKGLTFPHFHNQLILKVEEDTLRGVRADLSGSCGFLLRSGLSSGLKFPQVQRRGQLGSECRLNDVRYEVWRKRQNCDFLFASGEDLDCRICNQVSRMTSGEGSRVAERHANLSPFTQFSARGKNTQSFWTKAEFPLKYSQPEILAYCCLFFLASDRRIEISWTSESVFEGLGTRMKSKQKRRKRKQFVSQPLEQMDWKGASCNLLYPENGSELPEIILFIPCCASFSTVCCRLSVGFSQLMEQCWREDRI